MISSVLKYSFSKILKQSSFLCSHTKSISSQTFTNINDYNIKSIGVKTLDNQSLIPKYSNNVYNILMQPMSYYFQKNITFNQLQKSKAEQKAYDTFKINKNIKKSFNSFSLFTKMKYYYSYSINNDFESLIQSLENSKIRLENEERNNGKGSVQTIIQLQIVAQDYLFLGSYSLAIQYYNKKLDIQYENYGKMSQQVGKTLINIGYIYNKMNNHFKSLQYYNKGLQIAQLIFGRESKQTELILRYIGAVHYDLGNYDIALKYLKICLDINKNIYGEEEVQIGIIINYMHLVYKKMGNQSEAEKYQKIKNDLKQKLEKKIPIIKIFFIPVQDNLYGNQEYTFFRYAYLALKSQRKKKGQKHYLALQQLIQLQLFDLFHFQIVFIDIIL